MRLYDITDKHPEVLNGLTSEYHYTDVDIAAANFITTMSNTLVKNDGNGHYSEYNEIVDMLIKEYPNAVKLILSLKQFMISPNIGYLVEDYLNGNYENSHDGKVEDSIKL